MPSPSVPPVPGHSSRRYNVVAKPIRPSPPSLPDVGEFGLIRTLQRRFGRVGPSVLHGIGDDAAVVRPSPGQALLLTTDLLAEDIHFDLATATYEEIGYKAAVANLSDIAAMGGTPRYLLVSMAVPASGTPEAVEALYRGLMDACRPHGVELVGGDTSASRHGWFLSITLTGVVPPGLALTRSGASVGDLLYVTGTLGDSLAAFRLLSADHRKRSSGGRGTIERHRRYLLGRHRRPTARLQEGRLLSVHRVATAAIDISDGLSGDLAHLCEQSGVGAEIQAAALPLSPACRAFAAARLLDPVRLALAGGEDYELLFTVSPRNRAKLDRLARRARCRFSLIGRILPKAAGISLTREHGRSQPLSVTSYEHFHGARATGHEAARCR